MTAASVSFYKRAEDALADAALGAKVQRATGRLLVSRETEATRPVGVILNWPSLVRR